MFQIFAPLKINRCLKSKRAQAFGLNKRILNLFLQSFNQKNNIFEREKTINNHCSAFCLRDTELLFYELEHILLTAIDVMHVCPG